MRAAKVDRNQAEIVAALRGIGATVQPLHAVGKGCPDLLVGFRGANYLLEIKDWKASNTHRKLNPLQEEWHGGWKGQVAKVTTVEAAFVVIGAMSVPLRGTIGGGE
jgi:hypothetical protein